MPGTQVEPSRANVNGTSERGTSQFPHELVDAIRRARRCGDRGVSVVKQGRTILSAEPCREVPAGVIRYVATAAPEGCD